MLRCIHTLRYLCICHMFYVLQSYIHGIKTDTDACVISIKKVLENFSLYIHILSKRYHTFFTFHVYKILWNFDRMQQITDI